MNKTASTHDLHEGSVYSEWRDSSTSECTAFSDSTTYPAPPFQLADNASRSFQHLAFDSLCFSSDDDAAMAALLADSTTTSTCTPVPSTFSPSSLSSSSSPSPSLNFCDPSLLYSPSPRRQPPASASSKFRLSATSSSTATTSILPNSARGPWWHRALCVLWVGAKMCVMFTLMAVLWVVLALPTIDQQLRTLLYFFCQYCTLSAQQPLNKEDASRRAATHHHHRRRCHQASVFQIREDDDTSDGEGEGETATKPRLSGSQELKKSEEGESIREAEEEEVVVAAEAYEGAASPQPKPKKRVRFSID